MTRGSMRSFWGALLAATLVAVVGCPTNSDDDDDDVVDDDDAGDETPLPAAEDVVLDGACDLAVKYGRFGVDETEQYTSVQGQVSAGVVPVTVLQNIQEEGGCRLMKRENPFCDPPCGPGFTCDYDGECIVFPEPQDLGDVIVRGLTERIKMEPRQPGFNYFAVPEDGMVAGQTVQLRSTGGAWDEFEAWGVGVETMVLPEELIWVIVEATSLDIEWPPGTAGARSEIHFQLNIDQHGTSPATLICDFPDTGSATVPAAMIDGLRGAGVTGWPAASLSRRTVDNVTLSDGTGCVEFTIASPRNVDVTVSGYIPCNQQNPCPDGLTCNQAIELCE